MEDMHDKTFLHTYWGKLRGYKTRFNGTYGGIIHGLMERQLEGFNEEL